MIQVAPIPLPTQNDLTELQNDFGEAANDLAVLSHATDAAFLTRLTGILGVV